MSSYHNTNGLTGETLLTANKKAERQEEIIRKIFIQSFSKKFTASEVHVRFPKNVPITSIRRAITNLCGKDYNFFLERTEVLTEGLYGSPEHYYRIRGGQLKLF